MVVQERSTPHGRNTSQVASLTLVGPLDQISYVDFPELRFNDHESTEMPFRYVADEKGKPIMPEVGSARGDRLVPNWLTSETQRGWRS